MAELTIEQRQQFALLQRRGIDPELARELTFDLFPPEQKSAYPETSPGGQISLPQRFGLSNYPAGLSLYPIEPTGPTRRALSREADGFDIADNSAVLASINTISLGCTEAPIVVKRESEEEGGQLRLQTVREHRIQKLLRKPNLAQPENPDSKTFMTLRDMVWLREYCLHVDGNAYWMIVRLGDPLYGLPVMLIPVMPFMMEPVTVKRDDGTSKDYISYYAYAPSGQYVSKPFRVSVQNVLHFRYGRDPKDLRKGLGLAKRLWREVYRDDLATFFTNALLRNGAIPGLVVTPEEGSIDRDEALEAKAALQAAFSGDSAGSIAILSRGAKIEQYGFNPDQLNLGGFHKHAEERVAAVTNVPAMVAQLGAGLDQAAQFSNFHEAREMFAENSVLPRLLAADEVLSDLMRDFEDDPSYRLVHDTDQIRALQKDITEKFGRLQVGVRGGWITANEARAGAGYPPIDSKSQQVPLTQGEDNRINILVQSGGITLNEARQTVGLPPIEGGEQDIAEFRAKNASLLSPPTNPDPAEANNLKAGKSKDAASDKNNTNQGLDAGGPSVPKGRPGGDITSKSAGTDLERAFAQIDPDKLLVAWREMRAEGVHFVDVAFPEKPE